MNAHRVLKKEKHPRVVYFNAMSKQNIRSHVSLLEIQCVEAF